MGPRLEDGISPGWEIIGDMSKNAAKLQVYLCYVHDGAVWVSLDGWN
jgi:hypothetical protein